MTSATPILLFFFYAPPVEAMPLLDIGYGLLIYLGFLKLPYFLSGEEVWLAKFETYNQLYLFYFSLDYIFFLGEVDPKAMLAFFFVDFLN